MRVTEASVHRLHASFSAKFAPQRPSKRLSGLLKPHVAPYDSYAILRPRSDGCPAETSVSTVFDSCPVVHRGRWGLKYRGVWGSRSERRNIYGKRFLSPPCNRQCLAIGGSPATQEPAHRGSTHPSLPGEGRLTAACGSQLPHGRRVVHHGRRSSMGSAPLPGWRHARFPPLAPD